MLWSLNSCQVGMGGEAACKRLAEKREELEDELEDEPDEPDEPDMP